MSKYLGTLNSSDMSALMEAYMTVYGKRIRIVPNPTVKKVLDAKEIEIHAGKHAPVWFKRKGSYFKAYSEFIPNGDDGCFDCASLCETRELCGQLESLVKAQIKMSKNTIRMYND